LTRKPVGIMEPCGRQGVYARKSRCKERVMPSPDKPSGSNGQRKNEDLFRIYVVVIAIVALLTLSLPTAA
jgi:hypothetical protein